MTRSSGLLGTGAMVGFMLADAAAAHGHLRLPKLDVMAGIRPAAASTPIPTGEAYATGRSLLGLNDLVGALAQFRQAVTEAPNSVDALNGVAVTYDRLGRPDLARSFYEAGLAIDPQSPSLLNNLGYSLYLQGRLTDAVDPLNAAAASTDLAVAASAHRTLALVAAALQAARVAPAAEVALATPSEHIEVTSAGEQRLVLDPIRPAREVVASLGDDASLTTVAARWTAADDAALTMHEQAAIRAELAATAPPVLRVVEAAVPSLAALAAFPTVRQTADARLPQTGFAIDDLAALHYRPSDGSVLVGERAVALRRLDASSAGPGLSAPAEARGVPVAAEFDSDNHALNLFAAKLRARRAATA